MKIGRSARMASTLEYRRRARMRRSGLVLALVSAIGLGACSSMNENTSLGDSLPASIGLPKDAPARPAVQPDFLPVHEMPPARETKPLTEPERKKLEADLVAVRERQEARTGKPAAKRRAEKSSVQGHAVAKPAD